MPRHNLPPGTNLLFDHGLDFCLCHQSTAVTQLNETTNNELNWLKIRLRRNNLSLNSKKTACFLLLSKSIRCVDLGVQVDSFLDLKEETKAVSGKVPRALGLMKHARSFLQRDVPSKRLSEEPV